LNEYLQSNLLLCWEDVSSSQYNEKYSNIFQKFSRIFSEITKTKSFCYFLFLFLYLLLKSSILTETIFGGGPKSSILTKYSSGATTSPHSQKPLCFGEAPEISRFWLNIHQGPLLPKPKHRLIRVFSQLLS